MGKLDYLDALKRAMTGLPPELQAKTLGFYEQRFVDGVSAGRSEADVAAEQDEPKKIAMTLRANAHLKSFEQKKNPATALRVLVSAVGLAIFNLFMVVPAMVYAALLVCIYAIGLTCYVSGIAVTASGLAGANELVLGGPFRHIIIGDDDFNEESQMQTRLSIGETGIHLFQEKIPEAQRAAKAGTDAETDAETAAERDPETDTVTDTVATSEAGSEARTGGIVKRREAVGGRGIVISTDVDAGSRTTQSLLGLSMVLAGIVIFLLSLLITKYTLVGIKRYIHMNFSLIQGS